MKIDRRWFLGGLAVMLAAAGCRSVWWGGEAPKLKFGVIGDVHITTPESTADLRRALAYFRDEGVDAVMLVGDLSDWGLKSGFEYVADAWFDVFPDNRAPDGRKVEKLFITGNHDFDGWWYGDMVLDMHTHGYSEAESLVHLGLKECWEAAFKEPFADIRHRTVRGYDFISSEWKVDGEVEGDAALARYLEAHAAELSPARPFFCFRHSPPDGIFAKPGARADESALTAALRKLPNCVFFSGHTHRTLNDERAIWQGEFTAISVPALSYAAIPGGYENGGASRNASAELSMQAIPARARLEEAQGYLVSVYDDRMVVERYDFEHMVEAAAPWVVPLGPGREQPYTFANHAKVTPVPEFPRGATVTTRTVNADTRNARWRIFVELEFPAAKAPGGRVYDYEIRAEMEDGGEVAAVKRFLSPAFHKLPEDEPERLCFRFDAMDLPETGRYRFRIYPRNCFRKAGRPVCSQVFESQPGKDKPQSR